MIKGTFIPESYVISVGGETFEGNFAAINKDTGYPGISTDELRTYGAMVERYYEDGKQFVLLADNEKALAAPWNEIGDENFTFGHTYKMDGNRIVVFELDGKEIGIRTVEKDTSGDLRLTVTITSMVYTRASGMEKVALELKIIYREIFKVIEAYKARKAAENSDGSNGSGSTADYTPTSTSETPTGGAQGGGNAEMAGTVAAAPTSDTSAGTNATPTDNNTGAAGVGGVTAAGVGAAAVEVVKAIFGGNGGGTGTATAAPASNNAAGKPTITLDKKIYAPHDTVTVTTTGITEENFEYGVMLMVCEVGTDYMFNGRYEELSYGTSTVLFETIRYAGDYEMRLYDSARTNVDDLTPLAVVPFKVVSE